LKEELEERQRINDEKDEEIKNMKHKLENVMELESQSLACRQPSPVYAMYLKE
jgi:hypothetical protein